MKRFFNISLLTVILFSFLIGYSSCDMVKDIFDDVNSECDEKQNQIGKTEQRTFALGAIVKFKDGSFAPFYTVSFNYSHEYCNGTVNGENEINPTTQSNANGYVYSSYLQTYDYSNVKDRVYVELRAYKNGCAVGKTNIIFRWEDVDEDFDEHVAGQVIKNYDIILNHNYADLLTGEGVPCID